MSDRRPDRSVVSTGPIRAVALVCARDEEAQIGGTVEALASMPAIEDVFVVDDGSSDRTCERATEAGARVIRLHRRHGKGGAMTAGAAALAESGPYDVLVLSDADIGDDAHEMASLIGAVAADVADLAIARMRRPQGAGGLGLVKALARWGVRRIGGPHLDAPLSGQRALSRSLVDALGGFAPGYAAEVDMTIRAVGLGFRVREFDTSMGFVPSKDDVRGIVHRARQFAAVASALWRNRAVRVGRA